MIRALAQNARGMWFDPHLKIIFSVNIDVQKNNILIIINIHLEKLGTEGH